jgi:hypothetical protein
VVSSREIQHLDRGQQGMETPGQNRLSGAAASGDHHPPQAGIHGRQKQGKLQRAVAGDRRQGKGPGGSHGTVENGDRGGSIAAGERLATMEGFKA